MDVAVRVDPVATAKPMEAVMQVEVLKFLLESRNYLRGKTTTVAPERPPADLQAVERLLPDCEWFETGDEVAAARQVAGELWTDRASRLEFG